MIAGLWLLLRPLPVLAWSGGACLLAVGIAVRSGGAIAPSRLLRLVIIAALIQGWLAHSLNDLTDWRSGTDRYANERWSGGSGALRAGYLRQKHLLPIAISSLLLILILSYGQSNAVMYLYLLIGLGGAITYSHAPWRFAYMPLLGEWLAAFPAIVVCSLAFCLGLQGRLSFFSRAAAVAHALLAVAWLMQHHLPDWQRDLQAIPPKRTTVAWVASRFGPAAAPLVVVGYYLLTAIVAAFFACVDRRFFLTVVVACIGAWLGYHQCISAKAELASRELQMVGLILVNAVGLGWLL